MKERQALIEKDAILRIRRQCEPIEVNRSNLYYKSLGESEENLTLKGLMDKIYLDSPTYGVLRMQDELEEFGYQVNKKTSKTILFTKIKVYTCVYCNKKRIITTELCK